MGVTSDSIAKTAEMSLKLNHLRRKKKRKIGYFTIDYNLTSCFRLVVKFYKVNYWKIYSFITNVQISF